MNNNNHYVSCGPISVSEALRRNSGILEVPGMITSMSRIYKMIKAYKTYCNVCKTERPIICEKAIREPNKQGLICTQCSTDKTVYTTVIDKSYTSVINIELQDTDSFNDIDRLTCLLFDENTKGIRVGERVTVTGELMILGNISKYGKQFPFLYVDSINYENKITTELNEFDMAAIRRFCNRGDVLNKLAQLVEPSIINYNHVKKGLLLIAVNAKYEYRNHLHHNYDVTRQRLNAFFIGTPGLAKSKILRAATKLVLGSRYESGESSSGASLTAIVVKEDENYMLRLGPASLAKGKICAINEFGAIPSDEQARLLSIAEEGIYTINKYGINASIIAPTTVLASANPVGDDWINDDVVDNSEFPSIGPMIDRFDLIFIFRREKEKELIRNYAFSKAQKEDAKIPDYTPFLVKYIEFAGHIDPILSDEAKSMIVEFFIELNFKGFGTNRVLDTLFRLTRAVARLRLKILADADDAKEAISFYNVMLLDYQKTTEVPESPRDAACNECIRILQEERAAVAFEELIRQACQNNEYVRSYVYFRNRSLKMRQNIRVKNIYEMLKVNPNIKRVQEKPAVLQWFSNVLEESLCDAWDTCDQENAIVSKKLFR